MLVDPITITCPYCSSKNLVMLDLTAVADEFVEDCQTCCAPILYTTLNQGLDEPVRLHARKENG